VPNLACLCFLTRNQIVLPHLIRHHQINLQIFYDRKTLQLFQCAVFKIQAFDFCPIFVDFLQLKVIDFYV